MNRSAVVRAFVLTLALTALAVAADWNWSGQLAPGQAVKVKAVNGSINAAGAEGNIVEVTAVKTGRDADKLKIEANETSEGVVIKTVYPNNTKNLKASVKFDVRVPSGVNLVADTVNGDVEAAALDSEVDAGTVNGAVRISTSGATRAKTVNGAVSATLSDTGLTQPLELETVNGKITVEAPAGLNAQLEARTVNGKIETDLPLTVIGTISKHKLNTKIGEGGPKLALRTVNGRIELQAGQ